MINCQALPILLIAVININYPVRHYGKQYQIKKILKLKVNLDKPLRAKNESEKWKVKALIGETIKELMDTTENRSSAVNILEEIQEISFRDGEVKKSWMNWKTTLI